MRADRVQLPRAIACAVAPRELEQAFRLRLEAQHGWQFDTSWPTESETLHYALAA